MFDRTPAFISRFACAGALLAAAALAVPAAAQRKPPEPEKKEEPASADQPKADVEGKGAILQGLDKVTARISTLDADIGKPVKFGTLDIVVRRCQRSRPDRATSRRVSSGVLPPRLIHTSRRSAGSCASSSESLRGLITM